MASQVSTSTSQPVDKYENYIDQQLEKTRARIKMVDLCTGIFALVAWMLGVLLLFAIVDGWVWTLGTFGRTIGLLLLVGGALAIGVVYVLPLFVRKINPRYAARMIEQARPRFKNSLLNYLWLKAGGKTAHSSVATELSQQAAEDISEVSATESVDQSNLIRAGFIVVGLVVLTIGYTAFSPKNPLPTVARVINPFSDIAKPAMVRVVSVEPGDVEVFFGDSIKVNTEIRGRHEDHEVGLVYSTADGQQTNVTLPMYPDGPRRFQANLQTSDSGIQQNLKYKVVARDGESRWFQVNVKPLPAVSIQSLKVVSPKYTGLPDRTITGTGEVQGIEGTRVLIDALANMPIKNAYLEFLGPDTSDPEELRVVKTSELDFQDQSILGSFLLTLNAERNRPSFTHYQIRYQTTQGELNSKPNVYPVQITPDLPPELSILEPQNNEVMVPVNGSLKIELQATDVDYEISSLNLQVDNKGVRILNHEFELPTGEKHRVTQSYWLVPEKLSLAPGDKATFFATAADNRHSPYSELIDPNITRSDNITITITEADEQIDRQQRDQKIDQAEKEQQERNSEEQNQQPQENQQEQNQDNKDDSQSQENQPQDGQGDSDQENQQSSDQDSSEGSDSGDSGEQSQPGESGEGDTENSQQSESSDGKSEGSEQNQGSQEDKGDSDTGSSNQQQKSQKGDGSSSTEENSSNQQTKQGGSESTSESGNDAESKGSQSEGGNPNEGQSSNSRQGDNNQGQRENAAGDGTRDENLQEGEMSQDAPEGERIEDMMEYFNEKNKNNPDNGDGQHSEEQAGDSSEQKSENETGENDSSEGNGSEEKEDPNGSGKGNSEPEEQDQKRGDDGQGNSGDSGQENKQEEKEGDGNGNSQEQQGDASASESESENKTNQQKSNSNGENESSNESSENEDGSKQNTDQKSGDQQGSDQKDPQGDGNKQGSEKPSDQKGSENEGEGDQPGDEKGKGGSSKSDDNAPPGESDSGQDKSPPSDKSQSGSGGSKGSDGNVDDFVDEADEKTYQPGGNPNSEVQSDRDFERAKREKENLDFSKKATDLLLENLRQQAENPDPEFLERYNWTQDELREFIDSWEKMKKAAETGGAKEKRRYESRLKSLGLKPSSARARKVEGEKDEQYGLSEGGAVNRPNSEWAERYNRYMKQRNKAERD